MPTPVSINVNGRQCTIGYFPPPIALPLEGRLLAFLSPVVEGVAGEGVSVIVRFVTEVMSVEDDTADVWAKLLGRLKEVATSVNWDAVIGGAFRVGWAEPEFASLARELFGVVTYENGPIKDAPFLDAYDNSAEWLMGPAGNQALLVLLAATFKANFALPFFFGMSEIASDFVKTIGSDETPNEEETSPAKQSTRAVV